MTLKVKEFCEAEQKNQGVLIPLNNVRKRVAAITGVSEKTITRITKEVEELLTAHGHEVLRLPPYHCDLNPVEKVWSLVKRKVADKNVEQDPKEIVKLTVEAFESITAEDWTAQCTHVEHLEEEYLKNDGLMDEEMDRIIISTASDTETESDSVSSHSSDSDVPMATDHNYSIKL
ncbi:unnamed protein product, partial [Iphiclides podalirius]